MKNGVGILKDEIGKDDDEHVLQFLDSMDSYLYLLDALSTKLRQGWLEVASARQSMGSTCVSGTLLDLKPHSAATTLEVCVNASISASTKHNFSLSKWGLSNGIENDFESNQAGEDSFTKSFIRRRGPHGTPDEEKVPTSVPITTAHQIKKQRMKLLSVFGGFSSPKLREAQVSFEIALETIVEIANVRSMMLAAFEQVQSQEREKMHGIPVPVDEFNIDMNVERV